VAHVTGPSFFKEAMARASGFEKGLIDNGVDPTDIIRVEGTYLSPSGVETVNALLDSSGNKLPTAIFFANYLMAIGGLAALHDRGVNIPGDISTAVFGDQPQMEYIRPRLTRVGVQPQTIGERASAMLIGRLNGTFTGAPRLEVLNCTLTEFDTA
jgi:DNA-binding LacI/PurR family transcriptional regulator